ncbi:hypothetical protein JL722_10281 [Aureococcus anophagefferens]|nr:hypothetical protein JL722_10281 [Aureococcus anophagefferens]
MPEVEAKKCAPGASPPPKKRCARPDDEMHGAAAAVSVADLAGFAARPEAAAGGAATWFFAADSASLRRDFVATFGADKVLLAPWAPDPSPRTSTAAAPAAAAAATASCPTTATRTACAAPSAAPSPSGGSRLEETHVWRAGAAVSGARASAASASGAFGRRIAIHVRHGPETGPGLCAAAATAAGGTAVASQLPSELHISGIPVSIVLGACAGNAAPAALKEALKPGVAFATSTVLRSGIVAVGAKLSAAQVLALGWTTVPAAACSVGAGCLVIPALAARAGLAPRLGALLAAGTSICGVTAIGATAPAIGATQAEVAVAVANVVAFGSAGMLAYPHAAARLFPADDSSHVGLFLGLAVHDTAQVMGCAASYAEQYSDAAVVGAAAVAKLTRNVFLAGVVASGGKALGLLDADDWKRQADWVGAVLGTKVLLATGLAGVGLSVDFNAFKSAGVRPFAVGAAGATIVGGVGLSTALLLSHLNRPATAP